MRVLFLLAAATLAASPSLALTLDQARAKADQDAEALMVDPLNGDIYVATKRSGWSRIYRVPYPQSTTEVITMDLCAMVPFTVVTGADVSPDGSLVIIRRYSGHIPPAAVWHRPTGGLLFDAFAGP